MGRHITLVHRWPERYFTGLSLPMKFKRERELIRRRSVPKLGSTNAGGTRKKSKWTLLFHQTYPGMPFNKNLISKRTGIPRSVLNTVYDRGLKAWQTGGSRVGATPQQWAIARVYKFVLVSKHKAPNTRFDPNNNLR